MNSNWMRLINTSYRSLLTKERNYASFNKEQIKLYVREFSERGTAVIFDPMSGYGTLTDICNSMGVSTYCVEINAPAYLWQHLCLPENKVVYCEVVKTIIDTKFSLPKLDLLSEAGDDWISKVGLNTLTQIYQSIVQTARLLAVAGDHTIIALSILLPFVCRLATVTVGDVHHIKKGGLAVYKDYDLDFYQYLDNLYTLLSSRQTRICLTPNSLNFDNCITSEFSGQTLRYMITSPPYPNMVDYAKMFGAENYFIDYLRSIGLCSLPKLDHPIGTNIVKGKMSGSIVSKSANGFLQYLTEYNAEKPCKDKHSKDKLSEEHKDNISFYVPYFRNYFFGIQESYTNVAKHADSIFEGIIIVRNNGVRARSVPVKEAIVETWEHLGFSASIDQQEEVFHVGTKNPNAKGFKAKQMEYAIRIWRG